MNRQARALLLALLTLASLTACGGGGTDANGKPDVTIGRPNCAASGACT